MSNTNNNQKGALYSAFDLIQFAWDKKWMLIGVSVLAIIISALISIFGVEEKFESKVILFPASSVSISQNLVEANQFQTDHRDALSMGGDSEIERMLQVLESEQIRTHIIEKFDLMGHYEIDTSSLYPKTRVEGRYKSNINFRRTKFMAIEVTVTDIDPKMAADIANEIVAYADATFFNMRKERAQEAYDIVEKEYLAVQEEIKSIEQELQKIGKLGLIDYESQAKALSEAYATALVKGTSVRAIEEKMEILAKYGGEFLTLSKKLEAEIERYGLLTVKFASVKINLEQMLPQTFIVDSAIEAEKNTYPNKKMIVLFSTFTTFFLTLLLLLIWDNIKKSFLA